MNGLILIGGRSMRMGTDKSLIDYHGLPQRDYLFNLLQKYCKKVFFSGRIDQQFSQEHFLIDKYPDSGPMGAILTAFEHTHTTAWLIVACDMPLIDDAAIQYLIQNRNSSKAVSCFKNPETHEAEPLLSIWEPKAFSFIKEKTTPQSSPRKLLQAMGCCLIESPNLGWFLNVNTADELLRQLHKLGHTQPLGTKV